MRTRRNDERAAAAASPQETGAWRRWIMGAIAMGAGAVFALVLWRTPDPDPPPVGSSSVVRTFLEAGKRRVPIALGHANVAPGDVLSYALRSDEPLWIAVFSIDDTDEIAWVVPSDPEDGPEALPAGDTAPSRAMTFANNRRRERAFIIFEPSPFDVEEAVAAIRLELKSAPNAFTSAQWQPKRARTKSVLCDKGS